MGVLQGPQKNLEKSSYTVEQQGDAVGLRLCTASPRGDSYGGGGVPATVGRPHRENEPPRPGTVTGKEPSNAEGGKSRSVWRW